VQGSGDSFNYLAVLFSVVIGLAATELLQGVKRLLIERKRVLAYAPAMLWPVSLLLILAQSWWAMFGLSDQSSWTFTMYLAVLMHIVLLYLICALALPDLSADGEVAMRQTYFANRRPFFVLLLAAIVASIGKDIVIGGDLPEPTNLGFHVLFAALTVVALISERDWLHKAVAIIVLLAFATYTILLFDRLPT
jgi:hypothetical protein